MKTLLALITLTLAACGGSGDSTVVPTDSIGHAPASRDTSQVVMLGDSITYRWISTAPQELPAPLPLDSGVPGQTSEQIDARVTADAIDTIAQTVVILAGTNDILKQADSDPSYAESAAMSARDAGMTVVICTIPPTIMGEGASMQRVQAYNAALVAWAAENNFVVADYYSVLVNADGTQNSALFVDNIHPTTAGYTLMQPVLLSALTKAGVVL